MSALLEELALLVVEEELDLGEQLGVPGQPGVGVDELWRQIGRYREHSAENRLTRQRERQTVRLRDLLARQLVQRFGSLEKPLAT